MLEGISVSKTKNAVKHKGDRFRFLFRFSNR